MFLVAKVQLHYDITFDLGKTYWHNVRLWYQCGLLLTKIFLISISVEVTRIYLN